MPLNKCYLCKRPTADTVNMQWGTEVVAICMACDDHVYSMRDE